MSQVRFQLILVVLTVISGSVFGGCRQTFMTICDTFEDFESYNDTENLSELIIGRENNSKMVPVHFMELLQLDKYQLSSLIIINSISELKKTDRYECLYVTSSLKYLSLFGNKLKRIERYHFPLMPLAKFSLVNNGIESIEEEAFMLQSMEVLDLSNNLLETLEFKSMPLTSVTKVIKIVDNRLTHIPPKSFPVSLLCLNLDRNNLRFLQDGVFDNLHKLEQLTLSHNKLSEMPPIKGLTKLVVFDISYNNIKHVEYRMLKDMNRLKLVDLSHNKIESPFILNWLVVPKIQPTLTISLALNRLKDLEFDKLDLGNKTIIVFGNPWNCSRWEEVKRRLSGHESSCDLSYLTDDESPFCVPYAEGVYNHSSMWSADVDRFHLMVRRNEKVAQCSLRLKKQQLLYPVDHFCVFVKGE